MRNVGAIGPLWSTACLQVAAATRLAEPGALEQHLGLCLGRSRRLFALRCGADSLHGFVVARSISTLALLLALAAPAAWLW